MSSLTSYLPNWTQTPQFRTVDKRFGEVSKIIFFYWISKYVLLDGFRYIYAKGPSGFIHDVQSYIKSIIVDIALKLPSNKKEMEVELSKLRIQLKDQLAPDIYPNGVELTKVRIMPEKGKDREWLEGEWKGMKLLERGDVDNGRVSGTVYHGGSEVNEIINEAMARFVVSNPLHPDVFPGVRKMESEVVSMCLNLFNGPNGAGTTTSGGTESIIMACKTYRDWARKTKGVTRPEMVVPESAHAAFWKASQYFGIKIHVIPVDPRSRKANVKRMKRAINANTVMIVGSAPNFPDGAIDPIPELAELAKRKNIGLHVDCCLGSFLMPFLEKAGFGADVPVFDFRLPGVTSISCDTHKYGFCPKGSSVIMYNSPKLRRFQYYVFPDWSGGVYASPSMAGSRPGSVLAGAWAVMNYFGQEGYQESCKQIISAARYFSTEIKSRFPQDLYILGDPKVSVVAFASDSLSVYQIGDVMSKKGWHLNALSNPAGLHMAFTRLTAKNVDKLLEDLAVAVDQVKNTPESKGGDMVALYGMGQTSAGPHIVGEVAATFLDVLYE